MKKEEIFFANLGEIWRDITAIEFLMRCAIAKFDNELEKFPKPPYEKGKIYKNVPKSFLISSFQKVKSEFNKKFPKDKFPQELVELRNAMAHGIISQINQKSFDQLVKFRNYQKEDFKIEFQMNLEIERLMQIKKSLCELRRNLGKICNDKKI